MAKSRNEELNSLPAYIGKCCKYCGRCYPETILNIEGHIHHNEPYRCLNTVTCNRARIEGLRAYVKTKRNEKRQPPKPTRFQR